MLRRSALVIAMLLVAQPLQVASAAWADAGMTGGGESERSTYLVTLREGVDAPAALAAWESDGVDITYTYQHAFSGFAADMSSEMADRLRVDPDVAHVEIDSAMRGAATQAAPPWGLDRIDQRHLPLDDTYTYDETGSGVVAYIIDGGVRADHVDLRGKVAPGFTAVDDGIGTGDCTGHGTQVAGIIGGATHGVAKAATIVPVRVLECDSRGRASAILAGIDWVVATHTPGTPAVANISISGTANDTVDAAIRSAIAVGVVFVVAAGNDDADACTRSPARVGEALTVAASTAADERWPYSNWGSCVDLYAPGEDVPSSDSAGPRAVSTNSGTSMAAPHVAGIAARMLSKKTGAPPGSIHDAVIAGATPEVVPSEKGGPTRLAHLATADPEPSPCGQYGRLFLRAWCLKAKWFANRRDETASDERSAARRTRADVQVSETT